MDTDDLSEMAYALIVRASQVCDTLKVELGVLSRNCSNEEEWLHSVQECCQEIVAVPGDYVDFWNLEEEEGVTAERIRELAMELCEKAGEVLSVPFDKRGGREEW
jgi:hypothetical protein